MKPAFAIILLSSFTLAIANASSEAPKAVFGSLLASMRNPDRPRIMVQYNNATFLRMATQYAIDGQIRGLVRNQLIAKTEIANGFDEEILRQKSNANRILSIVVNSTDMIEKILENPLVDRVEIDQLLTSQVIGRSRVLDLHNTNMDKSEIEIIRQFSTARTEVTETNNQEQNTRNLQLFRGEQVPYGITMVQAPDLWPIAPRNPSVAVCVVDTGYNAGHEDLPTFVTGQVGGTSTEAGVWYNDGNGHGTHCSGTIGAVGNNAIGVVGIREAPSRSILQVGKGLEDDGDGYSSDVMAAIQGCVDNGAKVISLSLGGGSKSKIAQDFFDDIYNSGILVVAAAGNGGNSGHLYPGSYPSVISVSAVNEKGMRPDFSQCHSQVELAAPGVDVLSTYPPNTYALSSGTSMAGPHVAGIAAQLMAFFPECTNYQIRNAMVRSAKGVGEYPGYCSNGYGNGLVQGKAAYDLISELGCEGAGGPIVSNPVKDTAKGGCEQNSDYVANGNNTYRNECPGPQLKSGGHSTKIRTSIIATIALSSVAILSLA